MYYSKYDRSKNMIGDTPMTDIIATSNSIMMNGIQPKDSTAFFTENALSGRTDEDASVTRPSNKILK